MKWEQLTEKHTQEYAAYLHGYISTLEQLNKDRAGVLKEVNCGEENIPEHLNSMLNANLKGWQEEWGMYGSQFKSMRIQQQKEINQYFDREKLAYRISQDKTASKDNGNSAGR